MAEAQNVSSSSNSSRGQIWQKENTPTLKRSGEGGSKIVEGHKHHGPTFLHVQSCPTLFPHHIHSHVAVVLIDRAHVLSSSGRGIASAATKFHWIFSLFYRCVVKILNFSFYRADSIMCAREREVSLCCSVIHLEVNLLYATGHLNPCKISNIWIILALY